MKVIALWNNYGEGAAPASGSMQVPHAVWLSDSCLLREKKPFFVPEFDDDFRLFPTVAIRLSRLGKNIASRFAPRYWHEAAVWINARACGMLARLSDEGLPLDSAVAFDNSLISAPFAEADSESLSVFRFRLLLNDREALIWSASSLALDADRAIEAVSRTATLKTGDVLLLGFDSRGIPVKPGDNIKITVDTSSEKQEIYTEFRIK